MPLINFEFKARASSLEEYIKQLENLNPRFVGEDTQIDTYFNVANGRLKIREGNIENALIWYERGNTPNSKQSDILLYKHDPQSDLKDILANSLGIKVVVSKKRKIYFVNNVKIHFDTIKELGNFIEVEAINEGGKFAIHSLQEQCAFYADFFRIKSDDYISASYSDLIMNKDEIAHQF